MAHGHELSSTFIHLREGGEAEPVKVSRSLFARAGASYDRLFGAFDFARPSDLHGSAEEVHPGGDEVLYLVSGAIQLVLVTEEGEHRIDLDPGQVAIVPCGVWHRLVMRRPGRLLFINSRAGMRSRRARTEENDT
jgi:mannose-6-phosphate isomerase-like protein (cupin superfamily)